MLHISRVIIAATLLLLLISFNSQGRLVDIDWLQQHKDNNNTLILDVRKSQDYLEGHVPGAVNLPVDITFSQKDDMGFVGSPTQIRTILGNHGINNDTFVVIYDKGHFFDASRMLWVLKVYGHKKVALLDGGFSAWKKANKTVSTEVVNPEPTQFIPTLDPQHLTTLFSTRLATENPNIQLIDVRKIEEYTGEKSKSARFGHLPNALSFPSELNYEKRDGITLLKDKAQLAHIYSGLDKSKPVVAYCNKGKESAITYFVLTELGYQVSVYDGGWIEWGNQQQLPISSSVVAPFDQKKGNAK